MMQGRAQEAELHAAGQLLRPSLCSTAASQQMLTASLNSVPQKEVHDLVTKVPARPLDNPPLEPFTAGSAP